MGRQLRKVVYCPDRWLKAVVGRIAGYNAAQELYNRVQKSLAKKKEEQKK